MPRSFSAHQSAPLEVLEVQILRLQVWQRMRSAATPEAKAVFRQVYEDLTAVLAEAGDV